MRLFTTDRKNLVIFKGLFEEEKTLTKDQLEIVEQKKSAYLAEILTREDLILEFSQDHYFLSET